jgi:hypothetical protein
MSTRANVFLFNEWGDEAGLWFYRHCDGYPEGLLPSLKIFCDWVQEGKIRDNPSQSGGWLILIGASEYETDFEPSGDAFSGWKCGAYEPTFGEHGDIEFLYRVDLENKVITIRCYWNDTEFTVRFDELTAAKIMEIQKFFEEEQ